MTASSTDLRDLIQSNWQYDGTIAPLALSKFAADPAVNPAFLGVMKEIVKFFDRPQVRGQEKSKAVEVVKDTEEGNAGTREHPYWTETWDTYIITCRYRVKDTDKDLYSQALDNMQIMTQEVDRILRLLYSPSTQPPVNVFYTIQTDWTILDEFGPNQHELIRQLQFRLTRVVSANPNVVTGFGGILVMDVSASQGNTLPGTDYQYVTVYNVDMPYGSPQIAEPITDDQLSNINNKIPVYFTAPFNGTFTAEMTILSDDYDNSGGQTWNQIGAHFAEGEVAQVVFLWSVVNANSQTVTWSLPLKVTNIHPAFTSEDIGRQVVEAEIINYPGVNVVWVLLVNVMK